MAYSTNPNLPKARALAMKLLFLNKTPLQVVANRCGVNRSTIWRWKRKWLVINEHVQLENTNRPHRMAGTQFRVAALRWLVPTTSSRPRSCPHAIGSSIIDRILALRNQLKRCAEVVWYYLHAEGIVVSLSSVRRILKRYHAVHGRRKRVRPDNPIRPVVTRPGQLVETDTVHYICPLTKRRRYVYTVIDLYSRMTHAEIHDRIGPGIAANVILVILHAQEYFGFNFSLVQADNGPEYSRYFEDTLRRVGIPTRHSRLHRPNDNAHIERFNRTIQEECLGRVLTYKTTNAQITSKLSQYLDYYNTKRIHLGLQLRTPTEMLQRF
jgi:transposase InsO family protein